TVHQLPRSVPTHAYNVSMNKTSNPYVATLVEMGYDEADCQAVAVAGVPATYPRTIHGRTFATEAEYKEALADFINGM
ncbi:MAG: hypothetical protein ACO22M_05785, partial [Candidatus Nanopelagicaceae bacterium]